MAKRLTEQDRETVRRMKEIRELLAEFGLTLAGFDPGVTAFLKHDPSATGHGWTREPISLDHNEWKWLEPLLKELRELRQSQRTNSDASSGTN